MRPPRIVLLIDPNDDLASERRYQMRIWGLDVRSASSIDEAVALDILPDLVVGVDHIDEGRLVDLARRLDRPSLFCTIEYETSLKIADRTFNEQHLGPSDLRECIKIMTCRKRGPKPGTPRKPVTSVLPSDIANVA